MGRITIQTTRMTQATGESRAALGVRLRTGEVRRVRRGAYADSAVWDAATPSARQIAHARIVQSRAEARLVFSHDTAAAFLGIPAFGPVGDSVHATVELGSGRRSRHGIVWHQSELQPDEITEVDGMLVTVGWRTALDTAADRGMAAGVIALDHLLKGRSDVDDELARLRDRVDHRRPFRGVRRVDATLATATGLADTPLESLSLARCVEFGIPRPAQQVRFVVPGRGEYFTDFFWRQWDMIGEADGRRKYESDARRDGRDPAEVLWAEKLREDALRTMARRFVRWTWADAVDGHRFAALVRRVAAS